MTVSLASKGHASFHGIFSLEVEESPLATAAQQVQLQAQLQLLESSLEPLLRPRGPWHRKLLRDVQLYRDILVAEEEDIDGVVLASKLTLAGYRVAVRQALGGGQGTAVFSNLRHSFLLVTAPPDCPCAGVDFIVEPHFREQFEISHPTLRYGGLLSMVPEVFVGTAAELKPMVQLLCSEMTLAFEQHGLSLPPWRQSKSLLSKWLPSKVRDYDMSPYASPRAASPEPLFPLSCFAETHPQHSPSCPVSESGSGSITPAFSGVEDSSPRAVLHSASAALLSHHQQQPLVRTAGDPAAPIGPPPLQRKSLLSSSLAASSTRSMSPEQREQASGSGDKARTPRQQCQACMRPRGTPGMSYHVSSEWQQPAIRTVKMQGAAVVPVRK